MELAVSRVIEACMPEIIIVRGKKLCPDLELLFNEIRRG
jgi:hypothetical protein